MNSAMWAHPATAPQVRALRGWGVRVVDPVVKALMCGEIGEGGGVG
jgi:phosphopantothenoylcysteine synthetase/decarboxylase